MISFLPSSSLFQGKKGFLIFKKWEEKILLFPELKNSEKDNLGEFVFFEYEEYENYKKARVITLVNFLEKTKDNLSFFYDINFEKKSLVIEFYSKDYNDDNQKINEVLKNG